MEIKTNPVASSVSTKQSANTFGAQVSQQAQDKQTDAVKKEAPFGAEVSAMAKAKQADDVPETIESKAKSQLNQSILEASLQVSLSAGNEPLSLLYKAAIEEINKVLEPELGSNAIQKAYDSGLDVSPQATADRIVQMSTAFFDRYSANHPEKSIDEALSSFVELIGSGIDKGFSEARDILKGLNVLEGDIATNIDATYELVQKGLQAFVENYQKSDTDKPQDLQADANASANAQ